MKKLTLILYILAIITGKSFTQWTSLNTGTTAFMNSIFMVNPMTVYIGSSSGFVFKTTNGGVNWVQMTSPVTNSFAASLYFLNSATGYACLPLPGGGLYKTTNGGVNWVQLNNQGILDAYFPNENTGYLLQNGTPPVFLSTTNGGANYTSTNLQSFFPGFTRYVDLEPINQTTIYLLGDNAVDSTILVKTSNGGASWQQVSSIFSYRYLRASFANSNTGIICGTLGKTARTTNQGLNWAFTNTGTGATMQYVVMNSPSTAYCAGIGAWIVKTTNAGLNWIPQITPVGDTINFLGLAMNSGDTGYISGTNGIVLKTTNGGLTFINQAGNEIPRLFALEQNYPNPFNPTTNIKFSIPKSSFVKLAVYSVSGKEVETLVKSNLNAGNYSYDFNASGLASGVYFYRLETESFTDTKKMILVK